MSPMYSRLIISSTLTFFVAIASAQDSSFQLSSGYLSKVKSKVENTEQVLDRKTERLLDQMQKEEQRLNRKLAKIDSLAAKRLFAETENKYAELRKKLKEKIGKADRQSLNSYIPYLDTLTTTLRFLETKGTQLLSQSSDIQKRLGSTIDKVNRLNDELARVYSIQQHLRERRQYLKEQLSNFGLAKDLKKMNKELFYYIQEFKELKETLKDPNKIETKVLAVVRELPAFKRFFQEHSLLASVLGVPATGASGSASFAGLQTRASIQQFIHASLPLARNNPQQFISQQLQSANTQVMQQNNSIRLPELIENYGEIPDFKPNMQKAKSFWKRLEYGANIQFGKTNHFLPNTSEIAVYLGYKLNDNGTIGVGSSYKLGLAGGFNHLHFSHQGFGIRSFIDWRLKGAFYVSGGYEKNNLPDLNKVSGAFRLDPWQESGLIGITKKYPMGRNKKGTLQILFDFLSYKNIPRSQPILIRTGVNF
jgi:hypothetical protein